MQLKPPALSEVAREGLRRRAKKTRLKNREKSKLRKRLEYETQKAKDPEFLERCRIRNRLSYQARRAKALLRCAEWARTHPNAKHAARVRRRARLLAVALISETIDREAIIKRDKSICHICHKRVARKDLTLDHLIPVIHGGPDTAANLAVAHRSCNASRGTGRIAAQLRLFG